MTNERRRGSHRHSAHAGILLAALVAGSLAIALRAGESRAQVAVPFTQSNVALAGPGSEAVFTVALSSLPRRPILIAQATPDASHLVDMELEVEVSGCTLVNAFGSCPAVTRSPVGPGPKSVSYRPYRCIVSSTFPAYVGQTCQVKVRASSFGAAGAPASFDLSIRGETEVPTATLNVAVTTSTPASGNISTTTASFVNEGQNFRWIYDLDGDQVLFTPIVGRCEWTDTGGLQNSLPYSYQFQGSAGYAGLDCCSWQIDSSTGVTGAGQAIFFVNVSPSDPVFQPGDVDRDGFRDLCDNCAHVPNGPLLGSCIGGGKAGFLCRSNAQCPGGGSCSLSQDDQDRDGTGNACVPEPGLATSLAWGLAALGTLARRTRLAHAARAGVRTSSARR